MKRTKLWALVAVVAVGAAAAWFLMRPPLAAEQDTVPAVASSSDAQHATPPATTGPAPVSGSSVPIPRQWQLPGIESVDAADNYAELLSRLPESEQARVDAAYRAWGGGNDGLGTLPPNHIFSFKNEEQLRWLVANGYPSPAEVAAGMSMDFSELEALALSGNAKASALFLTREAQSEAAVAAREQDGRRSSQLMLMEQRLLATGSPFAGYVAAARGEALGKPAYALAGYHVAGLLGDARAPGFGQYALAERHQTADAGEALAFYHMMMLSMGQQNPTLYDMRSIRQRAGYPRQ